MQTNYDDIIRLPHHVSETRPRMSAHDRAAQFSPFAALTGYGAEICEAARLTDRRIEADDDTKARLDARTQLLIEHADERPDISVTFFVKDELKSGGKYVSMSGSFKRYDECARSLAFTDGTKIPIADIYAIEGELFSLFENENE